MLHIFVANKQTLKIYLEHLFVGIGKEGEMSPFLKKCNVNHNWTKEKVLVKMLSDISRVREGDKIVFYLQEAWNQKGKFFGVFEAQSRAFFDEIDNHNFLLQELKKEIPYRLLIKPWKVFAKGIVEQEILDDLDCKEKPWQMYWNLIYRKIKGNRCCVAITEFAERELIKKFIAINNDSSLVGDNFSFDLEKEEIVLTDQRKDIYRETRKLWYSFKIYL
ncbi:hypothetical protein OVS_01850 [Mycoplasma ovis str. Michigan]|uniref:EVE domain-containing protein n=1 Tax=Mycoplasma ovis str. Michigan TaxID=1415773 RepID=A0ABM5P195_9MOLU|nr:hypothetical protein [Mycoplasma ovis]AHC40253.1 hypothetical protein OVS_01850 [Mycoplasma ovis str. Michigan]